MNQYWNIKQQSQNHFYQQSYRDNKNHSWMSKKNCSVNKHSHHLNPQSMRSLIFLLQQLISRIQQEKDQSPLNSESSKLILKQNTLDSLSAAWRSFNRPQETIGISSVIDTNKDGHLSIGDTLKFSRYDGDRPKTITHATLNERVFNAGIPFFDPNRVPSGRFSSKEDGDRAGLVGQALLSAGFQNHVSSPQFGNDNIDVILALNEGDEIPTKDTLLQTINTYLVNHEIGGKPSILLDGELELTITVGVPLIQR